MKVTREQAALNRERIVETAARLFREKGFDGIGVADLMKSAGLTHGGFYGHFESKDALAAEAMRKALSGAGSSWPALMREHADDPLGAVARSYLTPRHRDNPGNGCAISALGPEVARATPAVKDTVTERLRTQLDTLAAGQASGTVAERRQAAIAAYAAMLGAMVMARAVSDPALSDEILEAVTASLSAASSG